MKRSKYALPVVRGKNKIRQGQFSIGNKIRPVSSYYSIRDNLNLLRNVRYTENSVCLDLMAHYKNLVEMLLSINICVEKFEANELT